MPPPALITFAVGNVQLRVGSVWAWGVPAHLWQGYAHVRLPYVRKLLTNCFGCSVPNGILRLFK